MSEFDVRCVACDGEEMLHLTFPVPPHVKLGPAGDVWAECPVCGGTGNDRAV